MKKYIWLPIFFLINQAVIPQSWVELNSPFNSVVRVLHVSNSNTLFAGGDTGFFSTTDEGVTWDTILTVKTMSIYTQNDSTWYVCTFGGINKTTNSGESWIPFGQSLPSLLITDLAINRNDNSIFASTTSGLYKSIDDGVSWDVIRTTNYISETNVESVGDTIIFIGGKIEGVPQQGLYRSTDNGTSWVEQNFGLLFGTIYKMPEDVLYLQCDYLDSHKIYRSANGGEIWFLPYSHISYPVTKWGPIINSVNNSLIMAKIIEHNLIAFNELMVSFNNFQTGTTYYQVWSSSWVEITALTTDINEEIYAGLEDGKIRKISGIILTDIDEESVNNPTQYKLNQNYPNPFNPSTTISYQLPVAGDVALKVYDVLGNLIETLVNEYKTEGRYNVEFRMEKLELSSGILFYQLKAGDYIETNKMILLK
jgi:photosystem II stability/assembly factor-like uncharacterized protein